MFGCRIHTCCWDWTVFLDLKTLKNSSLRRFVANTLFRSDESSQPKGWIQGNTRIGPVLEITTSYLYGRHGIEIRIWSLRKDNSQSWVRISHGSNKFVIVSNYNDTEILADPQEDQKSQTSVKVVAARSKAKAKPQRTEPVDLPSIIPMNERKWIDIEPEPCEYKQYCHVGNTAKQCRMGLFQDSDFAGDFEDSKSTSGGTLCIFGSHTFVPTSWMCKKQTVVSHSSTESEIISLDTGLRLDGLPVLELWDLIVSVLGNVSRVSDGSGKPESDVH